MDEQDRLLVVRQSPSLLLLAALVLGGSACRVDSPQPNLRSGAYFAWPNFGRSGGSPPPETFVPPTPPMPPASAAAREAD